MPANLIGPVIVGLILIAAALSIWILIRNRKPKPERRPIVYKYYERLEDYPEFAEENREPYPPPGSLAEYLKDPAGTPMTNIYKLGDWVKK